MTGNRTALCIGINDYPGTDNDLNGCVNDATDWANLLASRGFVTGRLVDSEADQKNMLVSMEKLLTGAARGDTVVITYSGHGTWVPDQDGDEQDGRDEALCPYDIMETGPLLDDQLFQVLTNRQPGVKLVFISDSCHSGTVSRLWAPLNPKGQKNTRLVKFLPPEVFLNPATVRKARALESSPVGGRSRNAGLLVAGCADTEYSYDAWFGRRPQGAFTGVALEALTAMSPTATYRKWWRRIRTSLPSVDYPQTPQLVGTSGQKDWKLLG